ncbi:MAG: XRE family transcriptional regulator [Gammaproteobacteria bacterium]|nr:MAG: XRE family transcriptional regulator [Gammaproteobacteria bacterium]
MEVWHCLLKYFGEFSMSEDWRARLKGRMSELNVSQRDLAEVLGLSQGVVSHYIVGRNDPSVESLIKICNALSISSDWLLFGRLDSSPKQNFSNMEVNLLKDIMSLPKSKRKDIESAIRVFKAAEKM